MDLLQQLQLLYKRLSSKKRQKFNRRVSFGDLVTDRWEIAKECGFGENSSCYDNVLILGDVVVGKNCWIGPNVVLDGSGGLKIGDYVTISAGTHIYSHDTVNWTISMGKDQYDYAPTRIGNGVYIGPNSIIEKGVELGDRVVIGAGSFVNRDFPEGSRAYGSPARCQPPSKSPS